MSRRRPLPPTDRARLAARSAAFLALSSPLDPTANVRASAAARARSVAEYARTYRLPHRPAAVARAIARLYMVAGDQIAHDVADRLAESADRRLRRSAAAVVSTDTTATARRAVITAAVDARRTARADHPALAAYRAVRSLDRAPGAAVVITRTSADRAESGATYTGRTRTVDVPRARDWRTTGRERARAALRALAYSASGIDPLAVRVTEGSAALARLAYAIRLVGRAWLLALACEVEAAIRAGVALDVPTDRPTAIRRVCAEYHATESAPDAPVTLRDSTGLCRTADGRTVAPAVPSPVEARAALSRTADADRARRAAVTRLHALNSAFGPDRPAVRLYPIPTYAPPCGDLVECGPATVGSGLSPLAL